MIHDVRSLELRGLDALTKKPSVDRLDLFGENFFSRIRAPHPVACCVVVACKRCLRPRNALERDPFCALCTNDLREQTA